MIGINVELSSFQHVIQKKKTKDGKEIDCIVIPLNEKNRLYRNEEKGIVSANLIGFEYKDPKDYGTHFIKQSFKKEELEKMSEEEKNSLPFFGNAKLFSDGNNVSVNNASPGTTLEEDDDLPF